MHPFRRGDWWRGLAEGGGRPPSAPPKKACRRGLMLATKAASFARPTSAFHEAAVGSTRSIAERRGAGRGRVGQKDLLGLMLEGEDSSDRTGAASTTSTHPEPDRDVS